MAPDLTLSAHIWKTVLPDVAASLWMAVEFTFLRTKGQKKEGRNARNRERGKRRRTEPQAVSLKEVSQRCRKDNVFNN